MDIVNVLLRILDIASTVGILAGIWGSVRSAKMWYVYSAGCGCLAVVAICNSLWGVLVGASVSVVIGIRNALHERTS